MTTDVRAIGAWLNDAASPVSQLLQAADHLRLYSRAVQAFIGPSLAQELSVADIRLGRIVVHARTAAAATFVRYRRRELLQYLQKELHFTGGHLEVRVHPETHTT